MSRKVLLIIALLIFNLGIGGYYWFVVRPASGGERAQFVERPVEATGAPEDHLQLTAKVKAVKSDHLLLETKLGLKEVAIDDKTTLFTVTTAGNVVKGEGIEVVEVGKEVEVVYPKPAEGEIPTALSVLVIY